MALFMPTNLGAQSLYELSEIPLLPEYCKYSQDFRDRVPGGNNSIEIERWRSILGITFTHIHHYCYGLVATNRATLYVRPSQERLRQLNKSIDDFDYVIQRAPPDFKLLPEIYTKKGENLIRLGRGPQGILELQFAIELKPEYWPPYGHISDYYKGRGDTEKAREWLEKGLGVAPNTRALMRRLAELDGRPKSNRKSAPEPAANR